MTWSKSYPFFKWIWSGSFMWCLLSACFGSGAMIEAWFLLLGKFTILVIFRAPSNLCLRGQWEFCPCLYCLLLLLSRFSDSVRPQGFSRLRILEWVAISFSSAWKWKVKVKSLSCVRLLATPWTAAHQAPPSMGFSRQEYWSGVPLPSPLYYWASPICRSSHVWMGGRQGLSNFTH